MKTRTYVTGREDNKNMIKRYDPHRNKWRKYYPREKSCKRFDRLINILTITRHARLLYMFMLKNGIETSIMVG